VTYSVSQRTYTNSDLKGIDVISGLLVISSTSFGTVNPFSRIHIFLNGVSETPEVMQRKLTQPQLRVHQTR
jgi:hypothetical protein